MAGLLKPPGAFTITPHKVSVCMLVRAFAPQGESAPPSPFFSVSDHNRFGLFLVSLTRACDHFLEPKLDQLIALLKEVDDFPSDQLIDHLTSRLCSLVSPDDLFNLFSDLRGILVSPDPNIMDDDQIMLDPSSILGLFVRRCILAFNFSTFEGVCHLLTTIDIYCKSSYAHELSQLEDCTDDAESSMRFEKTELESLAFEKVSKEFEARKLANERISFHSHTPDALFGFIQDADISSGSKLKHIDKKRKSIPGTPSQEYAKRNSDPQPGGVLRTNWQVQGYLLEQSDAIERQGSTLPLNAFESVLKQLQKLAPELHRVHFLRYLSSLNHDDYPAAVENLYRYFDYRD